MNNYKTVNVFAENIRLDQRKAKGIAVDIREIVTEELGKYLKKY